MHHEKLPITALPTWARLNDVSFKHVRVDSINDSKSRGLVTECNLSSKGINNPPTLLVIPSILLLSTSTIENCAKEDHHFRELLEVAGGRSTREDIMLYLLMQVSMGLFGYHGQNIGLSSPWKEYVKMLPEDIPLPTMWRNEELQVLKGTSLEAPVNAKLSTLQREFNRLRMQTFEIPWCKKCWWETEILNLQDWLLLDAWYRSRSLELPGYGEALVPCLDMVNHSPVPNAYYERTSHDMVALLLRPDIELQAGSEVTISYGKSKSEAEMLYSYGFIDENSAQKSLTLPLEPLKDDVLRKAKLAAYSKSPTFRLYIENEDIKWTSPFLYFMCVNEEDGLEFKVLEQIDGTRSSLRVFWQGLDVTESIQNFDNLISDHALYKVFNLRAVIILIDHIYQQLERLSQSEESNGLLEATYITLAHKLQALKLQRSEKLLLELALEKLVKQKCQLCEEDDIIRYLSCLDPDEGNQKEISDTEYDFS